MSDLLSIALAFGVLWLERAHNDRLRELEERARRLVDALNEDFTAVRRDIIELKSAQGKPR